ncbi:MAG: tail fiber domain-containing protein, partial [Mycobacterium sp.]
ITTAQTTAQSLAAAAQMAAQNASLSLASGGKVTAAVEAQKLNSDTTLQILSQDVLKADSSFNTGTGFGALVSAATASENDAHGYNALSQLTTGIQNAAHGKEALKNATTASQNAAHGYQAMLKEISGNNNVAHGMQAMMNHTSGDDNTAVGTQAAMNLLTGERNVLLGKLAGQLMTSNESDNILISHAGDTGVSNEIRIGTDGTGPGTQQKTSIAGIFNKVTSDLSSAIQVLIDKNGNLGTVASSRRYKEDIHDMGGASEGLLRLRPVTFRYKQPNDDGSKPVQYGLIAEEVAEVYPDLVVHGKDGQIETVQYYKLDAMLLNEVQKLSKANTEGEAEIATLRTEVAEQLKQGQEQRTAIKQLLSRVQTLQASVASGRSAKRSAKVASTAAKKKTHVTAKHPSGQVIASATWR